MPAIVTNQANLIINAALAGTACQATTGIKMYLGSNAPTASTAMTELTGSGYARTVITWNSASSASTSNITAPNWTNGSGGAWSITGIELWDEAGTPLRWWYGSWTGAPIPISNTSQFTAPAAAVTLSLT